MSMRWITTCLSVVAIAAFFGASKEAQANPMCGDILMVNTTLDEDLDCCLGDRPAAGGVGFRCSKRTNTVGKCVKVLQGHRRTWCRGLV